MPSSGLLEGLTVFAENTGLIVGRTLVDPSGWRIPVLVSNFGQETVMVEPFSEIGMVAQVSAIQPVMDQPSRPSCGPLMLLDHLISSQPYSRHSERTGHPHCVYSRGWFEDMSNPPPPPPRDIEWTPELSTAKSLCASTVTFRPGSHISDSNYTPSVDVSTRNNSNYLVLTFTLNWTTPLIWRDTYCRRFSSGNLFTRAVGFIQSRILCVTAMLCSSDWKHLLMVSASGSSISLTFPPPASRRLTGRCSVVQC